MASDVLLASPVEALWDGEAPCHVATRTRNGLLRARIATVGRLTETREADLLGIRNFGATCVRETRRVLRMRGLGLRGDRAACDGVPRDALGRPYEVLADGDAVVIDATGPLRLGLREREEFELAYKTALAEVPGGR